MNASEARAAASPPAFDTPRVGKGELIAYFLRLGATGLGGPIALCAAMRRDLVERHRWFDARTFDRGLALAQLSPGPLAAQLAMALGGARGGAWGAAAAGIAFVVPSFVLVVAASRLDRAVHGLPGVQAAFYGIGAAAIGLILRGAWTLARTTLRDERRAWGVALVVAIVTGITGRENVALLIAGGVVMALGTGSRGAIPAAATPAESAPSRGAPAPPVTPVLPAAAMRPPSVSGSPLPFVFAPTSIAVSPIGLGASGGALLPIVSTFVAAGACVFGSGLAIVPYLHDAVVTQRSWMSDRDFLDAVAIAMITPGPVVIVAAFIGDRVAGVAGAIAATVAVFLPAWGFVVVLRPLLDRVERRPRVQAFVRGVTAAACGAIAGAVWVLGARAVVDPMTAALALGAFAAGGLRAPGKEMVVWIIAGALGIVSRGGLG